MWQQKQKQANKKFSTFDHFATTRNLMMSDIHAKTCTQSSSWVSSFSLWVISGRVEWTTNYHHHRYIIMLIIFIIIKSTLSICWSHCLVKGRLIFFFFDRPHAQSLLFGRVCSIIIQWISYKPINFYYYYHYKINLICLDHVLNIFTYKYVIKKTAIDKLY